MTYIPLKLDLNEPKKDQCKGLVYRGYRSVYYLKGKIEVRQGVRKLKKQSCPGCDKCGFMDESIEQASYDDSLIMPEIVHGALYSVKTTNESTDWETGCVDAYDIEIFQIPQNN